MDDSLSRFLFGGHGARGALVDFPSTCRALKKRLIQLTGCRIVNLYSSLEGIESLPVNPQLVRRRLIHAESLRLFEFRQVMLCCSFPEISMLAILPSWGKNDLNQRLSDLGRIEAAREFCGRTRIYSTLEGKCGRSAHFAVPDRTRWH